jgi:hypothetical protein
VLGALLIGGSSAVAATIPIAWRPQDPSVVAGNAYGDTVWFDSAVMHVGRAVLPLPTPADSPLLRGRSAVAWARTSGTPVLILLDERRPMPAAKAIVDSVLRDPQLGLHPRDSLGVWRMVAREAGRFDAIEGSPMYGWEVYFPADKAQNVWLLFVTMSASRMRPYEIPVPERLRSARVVGEYRADLKVGRIERVNPADSKK